MFPDYKWMEWKFGQCPRGFWQVSNNRKRFLDWAAIELKVTQPSDWYKITQKVKDSR